jgi:hypothetical protein
LKTAILLGTALYAWVSANATTAHAAPCDHPDNVQFVTGGNECLLIRTARGSAATAGGPLFILIHGDFSHETTLSENYFNRAKQLAELAASAIGWSAGAATASVLFKAKCNQAKARAGVTGHVSLR